MSDRFWGPHKWVLVMWFISKKKKPIHETRRKYYGRRRRSYSVPKCVDSRPRTAVSTRRRTPPRRVLFVFSSSSAGRSRAAAATRRARVCVLSVSFSRSDVYTQVGLGRGRLEEGNARPHSVHISNTRTPQPRGTRLRGRPCRRRLRRNDDTPRYRAPTTPPPSVTSVPSPPSTYFAPT